MTGACSATPAVRLRAERVGVDYQGVPALRGVTAAFRSDRVTALVGPSGCGKTSFLNCLNRMTDLVPGCRVHGTVLLDGVDVRDPAVRATSLRRRVGMIFQKPNPFPLSIRANVQLALREHGLRDRAVLDARSEEALRVVGLLDEVAGRLDKPALGLSGGQQQRLCIARAIALDPDVLLMDEPCSALDPLATGVVEQLIVELRARCAVLVVTHNLAQARRIADEVAVFWTEDGVGRLIEQGAVGEVLESPADPRTAAYVSGLRG